MPSRSDVPRGYRAMQFMAREQDAAEMKRIAESLKSEGLQVSISFVHRWACVMLSDAVRGKSAEEIMQFFVEYRARRAQRRVGTPGTPTPVKA